MSPGPEPAQVSRLRIRRKHTSAGNAAAAAKIAVSYHWKAQYRLAGCVVTSTCTFCRNRVGIGAWAWENRLMDPAAQAGATGRERS